MTGGFKEAEGPLSTEVTFGIIILLVVLRLFLPVPTTHRPHTLAVKASADASTILVQNSTPDAWQDVDITIRNPADGTVYRLIRIDTIESRGVRRIPVTDFIDSKGRRFDPQRVTPDQAAVSVSVDGVRRQSVVRF